MFLKLETRETGSDVGLSTLACFLLGVVITTLSAALIIAVIVSDKAAPELASLAMQNLNTSGVENPVTAVLLNFRSYDTLLEIAVLLIVAVAVLPDQCFAGKTSLPAKRFLSRNVKHQVNPVLAGLLKWLVPLALLVGGYLLWIGAYAPGGAFQAGAVIAGAGVALSLAGQHDFTWQTTSVRITLSLGLLVFIVVAAINNLITGTTLQYPVSYAGLFILIIEVAATISIAAILLLLFVCLKAIAEPAREGDTQ